MQSTIRLDRRVFYLVLCILFVMILTISRQRIFAAPAIIQVATSAELEQALKDVRPGQTIQLADVTYRGNFVAAVSGKSTARIYLQGSQNTILEGDSVQDSYVLHLAGVDYWTLTGFTLRNASKGVMLDRAQHNILDHLLIQDIGQEAVHFRTCSSNNILQNSTIRNTGLKIADFGEGVYIGSDFNAWNTYGCGDAPKSDKSHNNQILYNTFGPNVRAEAIDAKEGTKDGKIIGNHFDASGLCGKNFADSWVDIKGNSYEVAQNEGWHGNTTHLQHGFETHHKDDAPGWGRNNIFYANIAHLDADGYGFHIDTHDANHGNIVYVDNQAFGAGAGLSNIPITKMPASLSAPVPLTRSAELGTASPSTVTSIIWLPLISKQPSPCV